MGYRLLDNHGNEILNVRIPAQTLSAYSMPASPNGTVQAESRPAGSNLTVIEGPVFADCENITSVILPLSIHTLNACDVSTDGSGVFQNCIALEDININDMTQLQEIGDYTFKNCSSLAIDVSFDYDCLIGYYAFANSGITSFSLTGQDPGTIPVFVGGGAFMNCTDLLYAVLMNVGEITADVFSGCTSMTRVNLDSTLTKINTSAFNNCTSLTTINFNGTVSDWQALEIVGDWTNCNLNGGWYRETLLVHCSDGDTPLITPLPSGLYDNGAYTSWQDLINNNVITLDNTGTKINSFDSSIAGDLVIDNTITAIGTQAFFDSSLNKITFGTGIRTFETEAFKSSEITDLDFTKVNGQIACGTSVFEDCANLDITDIPLFGYMTGTGTTPATLPPATFKGCTSLTEVKLHMNYISIKDNAFNSCYNLVNIYMNYGVQEMLNSAFALCYNLEHLYTTNDEDIVIRTNDIPYGITLGNTLFYKCTSLTKMHTITLPNSIFQGCTSLTDVLVYDDIDDNAFDGCTALTSLNMSQIRSIGNRGLANCTNLRSVSYDGTTTQFGNMTLGSNWKLNSPFTYVVCTDGTIYV